MALAECGSRSTITALNDGSPEASYCSLYYAPVRDHALRAARWNFAKRTDTLALWKALPGTPENPTPPTLPGWLHSYPAPPWLYSYTIPTDFLYARSIIIQPNLTATTPPIYSTGGFTLFSPVALRAPFEIAIDPWSQDGLTPATPFNKVVLTNVQSPLFEWTFQNVDESLWDSAFIMVQVLALAARLAIALTSDKQLANLKLQMANSIIEQARATDGNEGVTVLDHMPDWLTIRGIGSGNDFINYYYPFGPLFPLIP